MTAPPFQIGKADRIATAGSCFAQHISRTLTGMGFDYAVLERAPASPGAVDENFGVFPARFGNIYTPRQLLQLFDRAYGLFWPVDLAWTDRSGRIVDPFRPRIQEAGFESIEALEQDRDAHLMAVRKMFEGCSVFIFTFGLTEGWESTVDGAVFPLAPGVVADGLDDHAYRFHNFTVSEMEADMRAFIAKLRRVNPGVRLLLTVSPVALVATYEDRHVLESTVYSKSALRVVAETLRRTVEGVAYFPSFEIITGPQARSSFFEPDLREVTPEGVSHVMSIFSRRYLTEAATVTPVQSSFDEAEPVSDAKVILKNLQGVICEETVIEESLRV